MSMTQAPLQIGGVAVLGGAIAREVAQTGVAGVRELPRTGAELLQGLALVGSGFVALGSMLVRRGRGSRIDAGHPLD